LGQRASEQGLGVLPVGDLSQPRGGRASSGHASHQTGLDVDVWFGRAHQALQGPLPTELREQLQAPSILVAHAEAIAEPFKDHTARVLRLASEDPRVDRVFVHPSIKRELCRAAGADRAWLGKLRPWYGHDDHFHARLACPANDAACKPQAPLPPGDGCGQLGTWYSEHARPVRASQLERHKPRPPARVRWPSRCDDLL
jgi:penicillin-insensitive murein DD-endopeptidase